MNNDLSIFDLTGKVAVITGAAGLLGQEFADSLAEAGAMVVLADLNIEKASEIAENIEKKYHNPATGIFFDISDKNSINAGVIDIIERYKKIDILVNNAGMTVQGGSTSVNDYFSPFEEYPLDIWNHAIQTNITGTFLCSQVIGKQMKHQGGGNIINISSIYGLVGPDQRIYNNIKNQYDESILINTPASYSVSKGAIVSLSRYLATYWADKNIRVNTLTLGGVYDNHDTSFVSEYSKRTPMGRMANKKEYRGAIVFLASDASSYMTGSNLVIDGGWTAW